MLRFFSALAILGLCSACTTFEPPVRPNVSFYPTTQPARILKSSHPLSLNAAQIRTFVRDNGWHDGFGAFGFREQEAKLIVRGLNNRGYAELDARRAGGTIQWISFQGGDESLVTTAAYLEEPPAGHYAGISLDSPAVESSAYDIYRRPLEIKTWKTTNLQLRKISLLCQPFSVRWEVRRVFSLQAK